MGGIGSGVKPNKMVTLRRIKIANRVAKGMTNKEIAAQLGMSADQVKWDMKHICNKYKAKNRTHFSIIWLAKNK